MEGAGLYLFTKHVRFIIMLILFKQHHRYENSHYVRHHFTCNFISITAITFPWCAGVFPKWWIKLILSLSFGFDSSKGCLFVCMLLQWNTSDAEQSFWKPRQQIRPKLCLGDFTQTGSHDRLGIRIGINQSSRLAYYFWMRRIRSYYYNWCVYMKPFYSDWPFILKI